jgi:hypothetical protein
MPVWITAILIATIAKLVLVSIGVGVVSFIGLQALFTQVNAMITSNFSGGGGVGDLVGLSGITTAVGYVLSGINIRIAVSTIKKFGLL